MLLWELVHISNGFWVTSIEALIEEVWKFIELSKLPSCKLRVLANTKRCRILVIFLVAMRFSKDTCAYRKKKCRIKNTNKKGAKIKDISPTIMKRRLSLYTMSLVMKHLPQYKSSTRSMSFFSRQNTPIGFFQKTSFYLSLFIKRKGQDTVRQ